MPAPLTGLLPEELFYPNKKAAVIAFLSTQPAPANVRRDWLFLWALWVGMRLNASDYNKVMAGAIDAG
jgi:hypothetical protein